MPGPSSGTRPEAPPREVRLDAARSPAQALPPAMVRASRDCRSGPWSHDADSYDAAMTLMTASDSVVSDRLATALLQVKEGRLYQREGHARWSTYLRAFVGPTARWCQQEMRRVRQLRQYPLLAEAWGKAEISKSQLRVVLRVVTPDTQAEWLEKARETRVRLLDRMAQEELRRRRREEAARGAGSGDAAAADPDEPGGRRRCRTVMAPPSIAALVAEAVEVARKVEGYHIGPGTAVSLMAAETMTALNGWPDVTTPGGPAEAEPRIGQVAGNAEPGSEASAEDPAPMSLLGDELELRRELGRFWELAHEQEEAAQQRRPRLRLQVPKVIFEGAPAQDADAHQRVVFWSAVQGRVDALRGRLLRFMQESSRLDDLHFAGSGHYARERLGLTAREAAELIRLDRALDELPVAHRMYAAGRLGRRKAWLVSRIATRRTDRAWTRFALTHTLRLLEALVEKRELIDRTDSRQLGANDGMPPEDATFAGTIRACSQLKGTDPAGEPTVRVSLVMDRLQESLLDDAMRALRADHGADKPDWWCLGVMARHFLDTYADLDRQALPDMLRRMLHRKVIERDSYTCSGPECLQRGGLECDHVLMRSRGGPDRDWNLHSLCVAEHRYSKHQAGTLAVHGRAPGDLTIRMGSRLYRNDRLVKPAFDETVLDEDPWAVTEARAAHVARA